MKKIDDEAYKAGGAAFAKGETLRKIVERRNDMMYGKYDTTAEDYQSSYEIGFADALLAKLRSR